MGRVRVLKSSGLAVIALSAVASGVASASLVASDTVTNNPPYSGYINFNGLNGGSGFGPWSATNVSGGSGGLFTWFNTPLANPGRRSGNRRVRRGTSVHRSAGRGPAILL